MMEEQEEKKSSLSSDFWFPRYWGLGGIVFEKKPSVPIQEADGFFSAWRSLVGKFGLLSDVHAFAVQPEMRKRAAV